MGKRILIVDDSATVRQPAGIAVGPAAEETSLAICDVNRPRMSGIEMLERLHSTFPTGSVPIAMLTTQGQPALVERAKMAGAKGWIVKPFKPELPSATVNKLTA